MKIEKAALSRYRKFHGKPADKAGKVEIPFPRSLVYLGVGVSITYQASKPNDPRTKGKLAKYEHDFGPGVRVFTDPKGKALYVVGGRFRVTDWLRD